MLKKSSFKRYLRQILAIVEKEIYLELRVKAQFIARFLNPLIQLVIFLILFGIIFNIRKDFNLGYWNSSNYILFLLLGFCVQFSRSVIEKYNQVFLTEKFWKTLSATIIAPINRYTLLIGILISELLLNSIAIGFLFLLAWIFFPIPLIYILLVLIVFFSIFITFSSIGLLIGVFGISREDLVQYSFVLLRIIFIISCINFPKEIFPEILQIFIVMNPLYYYFDLFRITWYLGLNYDLAVKLITPMHIIVVLVITIMSPILSVYLFEKIYKKYGITGY